MKDRYGRTLASNRNSFTTTYQMMELTKKIKGKK
ncbi:hypothetical protein Q5M85_08625 [Paraclostridium bifermentans]|nr:hypothetical protein [Paraclostridium bifermentans]